MNTRTFETLELDSLLSLAARHVQTAPGRREMLRLQPSTDMADILRELEITGECVDFLAVNGKFGLAGIEDPAPVMEHLQIKGTSLEPKQILALEKLLSTCRQLHSLIRNAEPENAFPRLRLVADGLPDTKRMLGDVGGKILPNGEIDDNASAELRILRRELTDRRNRIHRALESIMRTSSQAIQEELITFRNDRFVIPVRTDSRGVIPGVVHGLSSSGQTTFIEPLSIIEQNNDLVRIHEQETAEVSRILLEISDCLRNGYDEIKISIDILATLDVCQAKALLAGEFHCVQPVISEDGVYEIRDARNILLEESLRNSGNEPVPISLKLSPGQRALVISGPNAGGKTVTLKTLGMLSIMAQMGFHIPVKEAHLPVFRKIFADIGDQQSMAANLSTFTAHIRNIAEMEGRIHPPSLVLLDEIGTGTDPDEGAALAIAIIDYFRDAGATVVASTHYPRLKMWASQTEGIQNASVEFDEKSLQPTYRLVLGTAGVSSGIEIARRMNLREEILTAAESMVDPAYAQVRTYLKQLKDALDEQENLRKSLESERAAVAEKYSGLEREFEEREKKRREELHTRIERILREFRSETDRAARKIKDRARASRLQKTISGETSALRRQSEHLVEAEFPSGNTAALRENEPESPLREGDRALVLSINREGIVESVSDDDCVLAIGAIRYRAERSDLKKLGISAKPLRQESSGYVPSLDIGETEIPIELNVIGMNAQEAVDAVDKFLDSCYLAGADKIRIIHGHGKGILRRSIARMLQDHLQVESFSPAPPEQGGGGATVVELKN